MKKLFSGAFILISVLVQGQNNNFPKEINLVFNYMLTRDYPELFGNNPLQFRPIDWQIIDIDNDGKTEVFLQTFPHFRQSPSITIFQIEKNDTITRIIEGFAPGHLIPVSKKDDYFDPHSTATAIDLQLNSNDPDKYREFAEASLKYGMSVVLYKNFIHTDKREGREVFIDLMYLNDYVSESSCANFQFSKPEQIIAGKIKNNDAMFFIAKVDQELFCYRITGFYGTKFIKKKITITRIPKDFKLLKLDNGFIKYENKKGQLIDLVI